MLFLLSHKLWTKHKKFLVEFKDYILVDSTDDAEANMSAYSNLIVLDQFAIPSALIKAAKDESFEDAMDIDRLETLEDNFFKKEKFGLAVYATVACFLETSQPSDKNIFIVIRDSAFKYYRKKFAHEFTKLFPDAANCLVVMDKGKSKKEFENLYEKKLKFSFTEEEMNIMRKNLKNREKELEQTLKQKSKKKKKKKKKNKGWGLS